MEISIIKDYKKVYEYETTNKMCCLTAPILATKLFDFKLPNLGGWTTFGISPSLIFGSLGIIALATIVASVAASGFSMENFIENDLKAILFTIITLILLVAFLTADFHIYIW